MEHGKIVRLDVKDLSRDTAVRCIGECDLERMPISR